ncbi:hypothetical protein LQ948_04460 [Jiella sp. MQZ9-1]|uniref:Uncharacterized protein n=2 Tax=Jiella flava TaxID=2816857 RepID=A0A939FW08_9HYPH|nr:hypothetical protein [Jiella flava]MCD2470457.1 hypothetical protein [Jiella flava]
MGLIIETTDAMCIFSSVAVHAASGKGFVNFSVTLNSESEPEPVASFTVLAGDEGDGIDGMVFRSHDTLAQSFEMMAKVLRRMGESYKR